MLQLQTLYKAKFRSRYLNLTDIRTILIYNHNNLQVPNTIYQFLTKENAWRALENGDQTLYT